MVTQRSFTVLPWLVSFIVALAGISPTNVVVVNRDGMGIEHEAPWKGASQFDAALDRGRAVVASIRAGIRHLWGHPLRGPALAVVSLAVAAHVANVPELVGLALVTPVRFSVSGAPSHMGAIIRQLESAGDLRALVAEMRANSPLPEDAQKLVDQTVVDVGLERLTLAADLLSGGLTFPLTDAMSVLEVQWDVVSKAGSAQRTMHPGARGENQRIDRLPRRIPVYITSDDFSFGVRMLGASRRVGAPLDTSHIAQATRRVNEGIEDAAINGAGLTVTGNDTPGVMNAPSVNVFQFGGTSGQEAWDHLGKTGQQIIDDVLGMIDMAQADHKYGPYNLYVNTTYGNALNRNFSDGVTTFPITIRQRIEQIVVGGRNIQVKDADRIPADKVALIQMTSDVIDIISGMTPTAVPWVSPDGFTLYWLVMAIQVPRVRADYDGQSGIVIGEMP